MKGKEQAWRRSPISSLAHQIRMNGVRQANILPTCSLDKSNRALYEPEDVRAKKSALVKPESRSSVVTSRAKGMLKQKVLALSTTGVTKENMDAVDRVKEVRSALRASILLQRHCLHDQDGSSACKRQLSACVAHGLQ